MSLWREDFPTSTNPLKFVLFVSRPHARFAIAAFLFVVIASSLNSVIPLIFKYIVDGAARFQSTGETALMTWAVAAYIGVTLVAHLVYRASGYTGALWANGVRATGRQVLSSYITLHSRTYFTDHFAGSLASKISNAANDSRNIVSNFLWQFLEFFVAIVIGLILTYITHPFIAGIFLLWIVVILALNVHFARKRVPFSAATQAAETKLTGSTVDMLSNMSAVQEYASRFSELERLKRLIVIRRRLGIRNWWYGEHVLVLNGVLQAVFAGIMAFGVLYLVRTGSIAGGDIVLVLTLVFSMEGRLLFMGSQLNEFSELWGNVTEGLEEIIKPHEIVDVVGAGELIVSKGTIEFDHMTFTYGAQEIFSFLNLSIAAGSRVGLVGKSGAGKSTLVRLLLRHYDLAGGAITIDGINIAEVTQESLRRAIAVVPQEPLLFHRSIFENIAYGKPGATETEVIRAAELAHAHDFIMNLPEKYESVVGERGVKLSGGERQRIAIARAILKNAPILILDEATSSLDSESEVEIQAALHTLMQGKTVIAIAHRLSTLREMDRILVLDGGRIVQDGTHQELLKKKGRYAELWNHQAGGFLVDD